MSMAVPVVVTEVGGLPELVSEGETGLLVPVGSPDILGKAIARIALDSALAQRISSAARQYARENYGSHVGARRLAEKIQGINGN